MRDSMITVLFFLGMILSIVSFCFTSMFQLLGIIAYAFGAHLPDWTKMVKYWQWSGISLTVFSMGFFICKGLGV